MIKVVTKAWFRRRWLVWGVAISGDKFLLATFKNPEDATNWAFGLSGEHALKATDFRT